jgi:hypothetical protein
MLESQNPQEGAERANAGREAARSEQPPRLADREVPLPGAEIGATPVAVHAWLDGEGTEADARLADARQVALWTRIADETAVRRRMVTPAHVPARIMDALPAAAPSVMKSVGAVAAPAAAATGLITLSPMTALLAAAGLIALGFVAARVLG